MINLWFDRDLGDVSSWGGVIYASHPDGVWAVHLTELVYPNNLELESDQILAHLGSAVGGIGYLLLQRDVGLSASLEHWSTAQGRPAAELGGLVPALISIDGSAQLALRRDFDGLRIFATTWSGRHLTVITPTAGLTAALVHRDDLDLPPPGHDQRGGRW
jgi:hypothetical protein